jgi:c(7)-type cytochrome triheme protein
LPQGEVTPPSPEQAGSADIQGGGPIVFKDTKSLAPVTFQHEVHASKGFKCADCHTEIFAMQKGATSKADLTMTAMREGKTCGTCHNGNKAFSVGGNCTRCHAR